MKPKANQAPRRIPADVREEAQWLYTRLSADWPHTFSHVKRALDNNSLALSDYFREAWEEFQASDATTSWDEGDKRRAERLLEVLEFLHNDTPKPDLTLFLDKSERQTLNAYCQTYNISKWEAISRAIKKLCDEPSSTEKGSNLDTR